MKIIGFTFIFIFTNLFVKASECYHYHTQVTYSLKIIENRIYLEAITKDPNKISIANYSKFPLRDVSTKDASIFSETEEGIIIKNASGYYYISKSALHDDRLLAHKIAGKNSLTYTPIGFTFFVDGLWKKLEYNQYYPTLLERVKFKTVKYLPKQANILGRFYLGNNSIFLIGDDKSISSYDENAGTVTLLTKLNPKQVKIDTLDHNSDEYIMYDATHFYLTRDAFRTVEDLTPTFKRMGLMSSFLKMRIIKSENSIYLDFEDGNLWPYVSAGISMESGGDVNFYPVENVKYIASAELFLHQGMLYDDPWSLINEQNPISFSALKDLNGLTKLATMHYKQGDKIYEIIDKNGQKSLSRVKNPAKFLQADDAKRTYNNSLWTYRHPTSIFYATKNSITFYNNQTQESERIINFKTTLKDLKLAYAFDDKILIENEVVPSIADYNSLEFLGSIVEVISPCDGGRGQIEIVVNYNYYFKDKNAVYKYHSGDKGLVKVKDKKAGECTKYNFIDTFWTQNKQIKNR